MKAGCILELAFLELSEVAVWHDPQLDQDRKPSIGTINQELKHLFPSLFKRYREKGFGF